MQSPTDNREDITAAIDRLETQRGTALGSGLIIALDAALPAARINVEEFINPRPGEKKIRRTDELPARESKGDNKQVAIVLLSDGQSNVGPDPLKAAEIASDYGVRIYTVGIGTTEGTVVSAEGWNMRVRLDEEALKKIADVTKREYFRAADAAQLKKIYQVLSTKLSFERQQPTEVTAIFAAIGATLALVERCCRCGGLTGFCSFARARTAAGLFGQRLTAVRANLRRWRVIVRTADRHEAELRGAEPPMRHLRGDDAGRHRENSPAEQHHEARDAACRVRFSERYRRSRPSSSSRSPSTPIPECWLKPFFGPSTTYITVPISTSIVNTVQRNTRILRRLRASASPRTLISVRYSVSLSIRKTRSSRSSRMSISACSSGNKNARYVGNTDIRSTMPKKLVA